MSIVQEITFICDPNKYVYQYCLMGSSAKNEDIFARKVALPGSLEIIVMVEFFLFWFKPTKFL